MIFPPPPTPDKILSALGSLLLVIIVVARLAGLSSTDPQDETKNAAANEQNNSAMSAALSSDSEAAKNKEKNSGGKATDEDNRRSASSSSDLTTTSPAPTTTAQATEEETTYTYYAPTTTSRPVHTYEPPTPEPTYAPEPTTAKPQQDDYTDDLIYGYGPEGVWNPDSLRGLGYTPVGSNEWLNNTGIESSDISKTLVINGDFPDGIKLRGFKATWATGPNTVYTPSAMGNYNGSVRSGDNGFYFEGSPSIEFKNDVKFVDFGLAFYHNLNSVNPTKHWKTIVMAVDVNKDRTYKYKLDAPNNPKEDFYLPMTFALKSGRPLTNIEINFECFDEQARRMVCPAFGIAEPHGWR